MEEMVFLLRKRSQPNCSEAVHHSHDLSRSLTGSIASIENAHDPQPVSEGMP